MTTFNHQWRNQAPETKRRIIADELRAAVNKELPKHAEPTCVFGGQLLAELADALGIDTRVRFATARLNRAVLSAVLERVR